MKIFLCETIHQNAVELLKSHGEIISDWNRIGEVDALISRSIDVGAEEMDRMPELKVIAVHGTGTDGIDVAEAKKRGIQVVYAPHLNANAVAELSIGLMMSVGRGLVKARNVIAEESKSAHSDSERQANVQTMLYGMEFRGKTCGLIGFGAIATKIAAIARGGFDMEVTAYSPTLNAERASAVGCRCASSVEDVLKEADVVFLCLPLTKQTQGMISRERLALMKKHAILVNTSRGPLVDEEALYEALKHGKLYGAASDVFCEGFPKMGNPLLELENFVATPHIGANTDEALYAVGMACAEQIIDVLNGKVPQYPVIV